MWEVHAQGVCKLCRTPAINAASEKDWLQRQMVMEITIIRFYTAYSLLLEARVGLV